MATLFSVLTEEAQQLIDENIDMVNEHIYDWIQQEKKIRSGLPGDAIRYISIAKRRKNPTQKTLQVDSTRINLVVRWIRMGFTMDDFKKVVDFKMKQWWGTEQQKFIRPETLYAKSHFLAYLEEAEEATPNKTKPVEQIKRMGD